VAGLVVLAGGGSVVIWHAFPLPASMLHAGPPGALAMDRSGGVLLDITGHDEQRRLPVSLKDAGRWIPLAVIAAEDQDFRNHGGVDVSAVAGALWANVRAGRVVRGASTITMQVAGMKLGHPRTYAGKTVEAFRALQMEAAYSKDQILQAWLNMAPFGGNLVGIEAASRAWFGKPAKRCSLSEAALLAALPNSPAKLRPDRFPEAAVTRRNLILHRMEQCGFITPDQYVAAVREVVLFRSPEVARNDMHVGWMALRHAGGLGGGPALLQTTIDPEAQALAEAIVHRHALALPEHLDIALVLVDLETAGIAALVGSSNFADVHDGQVNGAAARRSPGSALKPFVYAAAFESGRLSPESIVDDAPLDLAGWRPRNIDRVWLGEMTAAEALRLSRNTPALRIARDIGLPSVQAVLRRCGLGVSRDQAARAGLSIAVGGVEVPPLELVEAYATLARGGVHMPIRLLADEPELRRRVLSEQTCSAIEHCLAGPVSDAAAALPLLAAKTGTSSGHRDAIAAGWNRRWSAVVWVGRFDDGGDPSLLGADAAMPVLRELLYHPLLATVRTHRPYAQWQVRRAVGRSIQRVPAIVEPRAGEVLYALGGDITLTPQLRTAGGRAVLFLDGAPVEEGRLRLGPGTHELRLVEPGYPPHAINITVHPSVG
jgi:penicillin-binding protein 1C